MKDVFIKADHVELYKVLKFEGLSTSGGEAKAAIDAGLVLLNGNPERQKRKKLVAGDVVSFDGIEMKIQLAPAPSVDSAPELAPASASAPMYKGSNKSDE
ncbi:MAG: RNA-binding S4 domain-containing protein [Oceanococcus sp.]